MLGMKEPCISLKKRTLQPNKWYDNQATYI